MASTAQTLSFTDDSPARRVHGEGVLLLGGGRALLMQLAHPSVARGVAEHSSFQARRLERLARTLRLTLALVFGSPAQVEASAAAIGRAHNRVRGEGYNATDPDLLLWVWATLVDTALHLHALFVRPLTPAEAEAYLADMRDVGRLLGVPDSILPRDIAAFDSYVTQTVASLPIGGQSREIADAVFDGPVWLKPTLWGQRHLTAALLPDRLRDAFGLGDARWEKAALQVLAPGWRCLLPLLPRRLRSPPWFLMPPKDGSTQG